MSFALIWFAFIYFVGIWRLSELIAAFLKHAQDYVIEVRKRRIRLRHEKMRTYQNRYYEV